MLTVGEKAVGLSFNPSKEPDVDEIKKLYARIIDLCDVNRVNTNTTPEARRLYSIAITEAQGAQMWAVKAITWKD